MKSWLPTHLRQPRPKLTTPTHLRQPRPKLTTPTHLRQPPHLRQPRPMLTTPTHLRRSVAAEDGSGEAVRRVVSELHRLINSLDGGRRKLGAVLPWLWTSGKCGPAIRLLHPLQAAVEHPSPNSRRISLSGSVSLTSFSLSGSVSLSSFSTHLERRDGHHRPKDLLVEDRVCGRDATEDRRRRPAARREALALGPATPGQKLTTLGNRLGDVALHLLPLQRRGVQ
jgi:hypothetical protein